MGNQNRQQNNNNNYKGGNDLLAKTVDVDPTGIIYTFTGEMVEKYVYDYLTNKGVNGIASVEVRLKKSGRDPLVVIYLFLSKNSNGVLSNEKVIPKMLEGKIDKVNVRLTEDMKRILLPLAGNEFKSGNAESNEYYVKLNIFQILGLMLSASYGKHRLTIAEASSIPGNKDFVFSVIKQEAYQKSTSNKTNKYSRQVEYLEKNCN